MWAAPARVEVGQLRVELGVAMSGAIINTCAHDRVPRWPLLVASSPPRALGAARCPTSAARGDAGAVAAGGAAHRREHHARHPRREPSYIDDPEIAEYLGNARRAPDAGDGRRAPGLRVLRHARPTINAFALPGGFIGVHTGLLTAAETESELASVLAHEIAHVTQRHIARMLGQQQQMQLPVLAALAAAILLGRSRPDLARGAAAAAQAGAVADPAQLLARLRARGRPRRPAGARAAPASTRARWRRSSRRCSARTRIGDDGTRAGLPAHPPDDHRAHRRRAEPRREPALQAAPRQPGVPAGARQAARRARATRATR